MSKIRMIPAAMQHTTPRGPGVAPSEAAIARYRASLGKERTYEQRKAAREKIVRVDARTALQIGRW